MNSQTFLVTGAAGFIASQVCHLLLDAGHEVVGVDNLNDAYDRRLKQWRLARLQAHSAFHFQFGDIADRAWLAQVFARALPAAGPPFAAVFNLAAKAGVRASVADPGGYIAANVAGTLNLLEECRRTRVGKFILASTSSLYGAHNAVPYQEEADTSRPLSPYAASKKAAEVLAYSYHYLHGIDVSVCRYFTVYGPAGRPDMSIFRFVRRIAEDEPITVYGDGRQKRDFTYVDDIARGTVAAAAPCGYEVVNLGGDRPAALAEVIRHIAQLLGREARINYQPAHPADVPATWADIGKARRLLDWKPHVSLEEGLRRTVAWYLENQAEMVQLDLGPGA